MSALEVKVAQYEILKGKHEALEREHETLIKTLELLEKEKKQREAIIVAKEDMEKWESKFGEMQRELETVQKEVQDLMSCDETETLDNKMESTKGVDVIVVSDDDEEGNQEESNEQQQDNDPSHQKKFTFVW